VYGYKHSIASMLKNISAEHKFNGTHIKASTLSNNTNTEKFKKSKIAFIIPTFTEAAYDDKFYNFYEKYENTSSKVNITKDLGLLNSKVVEYQSGKPHKTQLNILSDLDVDKGKIFDRSNKNLYNVAILSHQEYVTQREYSNLKQFVLNGGTMIILDGNVFYAEVRYFDNNDTISLVKGHGWAYNGKSAWKSVNERWKNETRDWVGSNYLCYRCIKTFKDNPFKYYPHEEQYVSNPNDKILFNYNPIEQNNVSTKNVTIATYVLEYGKGTVLVMGIYSDDIIKNGEFDKFFNNLIKQYVDFI